MKNISFFLSSTFNDMQSERDLIREFIAPEIEEFAKKYGYNCEFIDLRWGIDTRNMAETDASRKILNTCFDEIKSSKPFFIGLLGERYGWVPDPEEVAYALNESEREESADKSITEMEIDCALRSFPYLDRCLFCFRDPVDYGGDAEAKKLYVSEGRERDKLLALRKRLSTLCPDQIYPYRAVWNAEKQQVEGLEEFAALLSEQVKRALDEEFRGSHAAADKLSESINVHDSYIEDRARTFSGREKELKRIEAFSSSESRILVVRADSGCGKSSLMAKYVYDHLAGESHILPFFVGADGMSFTVESMMRHIICRASRLLGVPLPFDADSDLFDDRMPEEFNDLLNALSAEKPVIVVVDALNQFEKTLYEENFRWLNLYALDPRVKFIFSVTSDYPQSKILSSFGAEFFDLRYLQREDIVQISKRYFAANHKEIDSRVLQEIAGKGDENGVSPCREPIYLLTLLQEMDSLGKEDFKAIKLREREKQETPAEAIMGYLKEIVLSAPLSLSDLLARFYEANAKKLGEEVCDLYVSAIALSRRGLSERLTERLALALGMPFEGASFSYFRKLFKNHLCQHENGFWDFNHTLIKQYFRDRVPKERADRIIGAMVDCLEKEPDDSRFKRTEYAYYLRLAGAFGRFVPYFVKRREDGLVSNALLEELQKAGDPEELGHLLDDPAGAPFIRNFVATAVKRSAFRYELGERYTLCALNSVYSMEETDLSEVVMLYDGLACAAEQAGRYALAKDEFLLAVRAAKSGPHSPVFPFYRHVAFCSFKLGQAFAGRRYRRLAERALEADGKNVSELLETYYDNCRAKLGGLVVSRAAVRRYAMKMLAALEKAEACEALGKADVLLWASRILFLSAEAGLEEERLASLASRCREGLIEGDPLAEAEICYHLGMYLSDPDPDGARLSFERAHAAAKEAIRANNMDMRAFALMADICEVCGNYLAGGGENGYFEEEREALGRILTVQPSLSAAERYLRSAGKEDTALKKEAKRIRKEGSRGELTANQKALNKIIVAVVLGVTVAFLVVMPLLFSVFRGTITFIVPRVRSIFNLFFYFYVVAAFETFLNLFFCLGTYSLLQFARPTSGYTERVSWLKKAVGFFIAFALFLGAFALLWQWELGVYLLTDPFLSYELPTLCLLASGIMLVVMVVHEVYSFIAQERTARPEAHSACVILRSGKRKISGLIVDAAFLAGTILLYVVGAVLYPRSGKTDLTMFTSPVFVFPKLYFWIAAGMAALLLVAKLIRMTVIVVRGRRKYAKTEN